ncbi:MAG: GntR family transcriptional regulator [Gammaproteobacteria bacterium]
MNFVLPKARGNKPLYQVVEDHIRERIDAGALVPGDLIPSEAQLAKQLDVSQGTVKKAIDNLVWERLLFRHQGKGTYVSAIDFNNSLFRFTTYGDASGQPTRIHKETTDRRLVDAGKDIRKQLEVSDKAQVLYLERVGYVEEEPVMVEYSHWRSELVQGLENESLHIPDLLYALIVEEFGVPVVRAEETLTAGAADTATAQHLNIEPGAPVLVLNRTTYTRGNRIIEVRTSKGRADRFSYKTEIR